MLPLEAPRACRFQELLAQRDTFGSEEGLGVLPYADGLVQNGSTELFTIILV